MIKQIILFLFIIIISYNNVSFGQFTITNPLKTNDVTGLKIGDNAALTASTGVDPNGEGWLRLTNATTNQKGYMYVKQSFPTSLGLVIDFEYTDWRNVDDLTYFGADGFSIFLFDGSVTEANFKLGGYGGSLGYATFSNPAGTKGLSGGYLGIGFDEYGSYSKANEGRNGGTTDFVPNAIVLRGPTSNVTSQSNVYLGAAALGVRTGSFNDIRKRNEIDFNDTSKTRPSASIFYRRVQISINKSGNNYIVNIKWRKENQSDFTDVLTKVIDSSVYPLPSTLKLGFAASTGGGFNFHEIRNILLTTPGNLRVDSRSDAALVCQSTKTPIIFKVEVTNDTASDLTNINYNTKIKDANGSLVDISKFRISGVSLTNNFTNSTIPTQNFTTNEISGMLGLPANTSGIVTIAGEYIKGGSANSSFTAETNVSTDQVSDFDLTNNITTTKIDIRKCNLMSNPSLPTKYK